MMMDRNMASVNGVRLVALLMVGALLASGCFSRTRLRSAERKQAKSEQKVADRKLELIDKYQNCMKKAETDAQAQDCDTYRQSAAALD